MVRVALTNWSCVLCRGCCSIAELTSIIYAQLLLGCRVTHRSKTICQCLRRWKFGSLHAVITPLFHACLNIHVSLGLVWANLNLCLLFLWCRYEQLGKTGSAERAEQHRRTLRQALHVWLDQFPEDFCEPPNFPCLSHLGTDQIISAASPYSLDTWSILFSDFLCLFTFFCLPMFSTSAFTFFYF
jgi:hypothetical protein